MNFKFVALFTFLLLAFFVERKTDNSHFNPISGAIFTVNESTSPNNSQNSVTEFMLFSNTSTGTAQSGTNATFTTDSRSASLLPILQVASEQKLPEKFIAVLTPLGDSQFVLVKSQVRNIQPKRKILQSKKPTMPALEQQKGQENLNQNQNPVETPQVQKEENKQIVSSFHFLNDIVKNSQSSYYFTEKTLTIKNVTITVISITPYQEKDILKFQVTNSQQEYFFIANVSLYQQKTLLSAEFYFQPLVAPAKSIECVALIPRVPHTQLTLSIAESGGKNRIFHVPFTTT